MREYQMEPQNVALRRAAARMFNRIAQRKLAELQKGGTQPQDKK